MPRYVVIPRTFQVVGRAVVENPADRAEAIQLRRAGFAQGIISRLASRYAPTTDVTSLGNVKARSRIPHPDESPRVKKLAAINVLLVEGPPDVKEFLSNDEEVESVLEEEILSIPPPQRVTAAATPTPWHIAAIGADVAHVGGFTGKDVWVGIADTGIDGAHPEFLEKSVLFAEFDASGTQISALPHDSDQHGTHVAGIATGQNVGVAPEASVAVALVLPGGGGTSPQVLAGLNWLVTLTRPDAKQGVDLISLSLSASTPDGTSVYSSAYKPVIATIRALGIEVIAAIGNSGQGTHGSPGDYAQDVIGIGAIDKLNVPAAWSSCAKVAQEGNVSKPDFMAPGVDIYSSKPGGGYRLDSGTSMATPAAAGLAALLLQQSGLSADLASLFASHAKPLTGSRPCGGVAKLFF
jgi:subtilisin family serine protease